MAAKKDLVSVRVLTAVRLDDIDYRADQLVGFPQALAESLEKSGSVDPHKDAVAYCKAQGAELIEHSPESEE
ncbi:hypothetical protein [Pseudomonas syringae]|uniref:Uncharacterized protein n=1 Tax=Pseudomonas syringae TaxID=317 RepID=A0A085V6R6_PSESX|nr:hypothetical protein [Pseudomonas syringae]KFE51129.1 hypothetical protein IV02_14090 [Pseudomonas syringae]